MILLDSNIVIYLSQGKLKIDDVFSSNDRYAVSIVTYMEIFSYALTSKDEIEFLQEIFSMLDIIDLNREIAECVIALRKKRKLKLPDAIIVATAKVEDAVLLTNDKQLTTLEDVQTRLLPV